MSATQTRSGTDAHWDWRARTIAASASVNTPNVEQRDLELAAIEPFLRPDMLVLEAGCGNGHTTAWLRERVADVTAFDVSAAMVERARAERGGSFHVADVRDLSIPGAFDLVLCVRVLINLADLAEQKRALEQLAARVNPGGLLIVVEGFRDGFDELDRLRARVGLDRIEPAPINFYSYSAWVVGDLRLRAVPFEPVATFHLGMFDLLTRVCGVGSASAASVARQCNPDELAPLSRIRGYVLRRPA